MNLKGPPATPMMCRFECRFGPLRSTAFLQSGEELVRSFRLRRLWEGTQRTAVV